MITVNSFYTLGGSMNDYKGKDKHLIFGNLIGNNKYVMLFSKCVVKAIVLAQNLVFTFTCLLEVSAGARLTIKNQIPVFTK